MKSYKFLMFGILITLYSSRCDECSLRDISSLHNIKVIRNTGGLDSQGATYSDDIAVNIACVKDAFTLANKTLTNKRNE